MKFHYMLFLLLACSVNTSQAFTTHAEADAANGFSCCNPSIDIAGGEDVSHTNADSHANASLFQQEFDLTTPSGYLFRRQAIATSSASPGILKALASAGFFVGRPGLGFLVVGSRAEADFTDSIRIPGPSLGFTEVNMSFPVSGGFSGAATALGELVIGNTKLVEFVEGLHNERSFTCAINIENCSGTFKVTLPFNTDIAIHAMLSVIASASTSPANLDSIADYSHTAKVFLSAADPLYHIVSESGFDYSPVPVPGAFWLFTTGLLGLCLPRRRPSLRH